MNSDIRINRINRIRPPHPSHHRPLINHRIEMPAQIPSRPLTRPIRIKSSRAVTDSSSSATVKIAHIMRQRLNHIGYTLALARERSWAMGCVDAGEDFVCEDDVVGGAGGAFNGGVGLEEEVEGVGGGDGAVDDEAGFGVAVIVCGGVLNSLSRGFGIEYGEETSVVAFADDDQGEAW